MQRLPSPRQDNYKKKNNFSVSVKIRTFGHHALEWFIASIPTYGRLVHMGETFNICAYFGL